MSQAAPTCLRCKHWLPRETPSWAARIGLAVCAKKLTKAVTLNHWASCDEFALTTEEGFRRRVADLKADGVKLRKAVAP